MDGMEGWMNEWTDEFMINRRRVGWMDVRIDGRDGDNGSREEGRDG
jgi:hypothetical protein